MQEQSTHRRQPHKSKNERAPTFQHYKRLGVGAVVCAVVISCIVAFRIPLDDPTPELAETSTEIGAGTFEPTVQLPSAPVAVVTEELRIELEQLGASLLKQYPDVPRAMHVVALLDADLQKTTEAAKIWRDCLAISDKDAGPYLGLAQVLMELGKDEAAVEVLRDATEAGCEVPEVYHEMSVALAKLGMLEEALVHSKRSLELNADSPETWAQLGLLQLQLGEHSDAEVSLRKAITLGKKEPGILISLANACMRQGKLDEAAKLRDEFAERTSGPNAAGDFQEKYDAGLREIAVAAFARAATVYDRHGDAEAAERHFLRALALAPNSSAVCTELTVFYRRRSRLADSREVQRRLVEIEPLVAAHYLNLASIASQLGDFSESEQALKHFLSLQPNVALGYVSLGQLYLQMERFELARENATTALQQPSITLEETLNGYWVLAIANQQLGDAAGAEAALAKIRQLSPNDARLRQPETQLP